MIEIKYDLQVGQNFKIIERESDIHVIESKLRHIRERNSNLLHFDHET